MGSIVGFGVVGVVVGVPVIVGVPVVGIIEGTGETEGAAVVVSPQMVAVSSVPDGPASTLPVSSLVIIHEIS